MLKRSQKLTTIPFVRNIFTLMTGTALAQFIPVILSPVLTRIYSPETFGGLALFMSISRILAIPATGRYEQSIILPEEDDDALNIVVLCIGLATVFCLVLGFLFSILNGKIASLIQLERLNIYLSLIPISIFLLAVYQSTYYWFNRLKLYKAITFNKIALSLAVVATQLALFRISDIGLVLGYVLGQLVGVICAFCQMHLFSRETSQSFTITTIRIKQQARRHIKFPKFLLLGHLMNAISGNMPIVLFQSFYGASFSGFYSLTFRVIALPMSLIGTAISDVFREAASKQYLVEGQCRSLFLKTFKYLLLIAIMPFVFFAVASPYLFTLFFGQGWTQAGIYARLLSPMLFCQFITIPLCSMFIIAEKQELDLAWQVARLILSIGSIWVGYAFFKSDESSVLLFSIVFCILYLVSGVMSYSFSCPKKATANAG